LRRAACGLGIVRLAAFVLVLCFALFSLPALAQEYSIGEGDLLRITVYDNPDLTTSTRVSGEGKITFPLIGDVEVNGLTVADVQQRIAEKLQQGFLVNPEVSVFIAEYKSKKVTLLGEFQKPGLIELRGNVTLMEVISTAGGVTANAGDDLVIKRRMTSSSGGPPEEVTITVPLAAFLLGKVAVEPAVVADGDSIYVPRAAFVHVSAIGEFQKPGLIELRVNATLMEAISTAGGVTASAGDDLVIKRKLLGAGATTPEEVTITVPLAEFLEGRNKGEPLKIADGDSIYVPRVTLSHVSALGEFLKPGLIELKGAPTLMEVISNAGGVSANASDELVIKRKVVPPGGGAPEEVTITVPLGAFLEGRSTGEPVKVADGDSIYVPRAAFAYVSGAVKTPGAYKITQGLTVLKAITLAGGFTERAATGKVAVIRKSGAGETTHPVKMEELVLPEDVIAVPESLF
jgi:polysaccharide export outer membrane protein